MEKERPKRERISDRIKRSVTSVLRRRRRRAAKNARNRESEMPELQLHKEAVSSECDEIPQRVELFDINHDEPEQQQDTSSPEENSQATQGVNSASDEKLLKDMPSGGYQRLVTYLQPLSATGRDYRSLADKMGCTNQYIQYLGSTSDPVLNLINKYMHQKEDRKISELISLLTDMERIDVVLELQPYIDVTPTPREVERHQQRLEEIEVFRTIHESYDAFVCSAKNAKKDKHFVEKLVKKMEGPPYNLRLCLSERDFLGGGCYLETAAVAIEERCTKFVAILSTNFDNSDGALFESHIAMSLSPGAQEQRFIPVLIEEAYRNRIPRTIQHLTYLDYIREEEATFWYRLACSLGWKK